MRITGGQAGGRRLLVPAAGIRPTQDKVRAAIFSALANFIPGARVLDLFAGTGALGLEAWSRGAQWIEWVENHPLALKCLRENLLRLNVPREMTRIHRAEAFAFLAAGCPGEPFDLILADPPYAEAREKNWLVKLADVLARKQWIRSGGVWVYETEDQQEPPELADWRLVRDKTYGITRVFFWMRPNNVTEKKS